MAKTDVKLYATGPDAKTTTATISDVNPAATSSQLVQMGHLLNNLTQNTYGKTDRINTINCDTEGGGGKLTPTISLSKTSCTLADLRDSGTAATAQYEAMTVITTDSDGEVFVKDNNLPAYQAVAAVLFTRPNDGAKILNVYCVKNYEGQTQAVAQTVTIYQAESDTYTAAEVTFTITA